MTPFFRKLQESEEANNLKNPVAPTPASGTAPEHLRHPQDTSLRPEPQQIQIGETRATFGVDPRGNDQIRDMAFIRQNKLASDSIEDDWNSRHSPLNFVILVSLVTILIVVGWFGYRWMTSSYSETPPVIGPDSTPYKVRPENPGGMVIPHQDKLVYGHLTPGQQQPVERLLPQPEQPIAVQDQARQGYPQGNGQQQQPMYNQQQSPQAYTQQPVYGPQQAQQQQPPAPYGQQPGNNAYPQQAPNAGVNMAPQPQGMAPAPAPVYGQPQGYAPQQPYGQQAQQYQPAPGQQPGVVPAQYPQQNMAPGQQQPNVALAPGNQEPRQAEDTARTALDDLISDELAGREPAQKIAAAEEAQNMSPFAQPESTQALNGDAQSSQTDTGSYRLQIASFPTEGEARSEIKRLKSLDPTLFKDRKFIVQKSEISGTGKPTFKVMVAFFPSANAASKFKSKLKVHKVNAIVVKSAS